MEISRRTSPFFDAWVDGIYRKCPEASLHIYSAALARGAAGDAVPDSILRLADAMGDQTDRLDLSEKRVLQALALPVETLLLEKIPTVSPRSALVKALAIMEAYNSTYVFLREDGEYGGVVTRMIIARRMLESLKELERAREPA